MRERNRYAAIIVFTLYVIDMVAMMQFSVLRILLTALLLTNVRATWIASQWTPGSNQADLPPRMNDTLGDKFADRLPQWLWPKVRVPYYLFSAVFLTLTCIGLAMIAAKHAAK